MTGKATGGGFGGDFTEVGSDGPGLEIIGIGGFSGDAFGGAASGRTGGLGRTGTGTGAGKGLEGGMGLGSGLGADAGRYCVGGRKSRFSRILSIFRALISAAACLRKVS